MHKNFVRNEGLTFETEDTKEGYRVTLIEKTARWDLGVNFESEELANKAGQAILDYAYGTPREAEQFSEARLRTRHGSGMKSDPGEIPEAAEKPKATRKAPKRKQKSNTANSAAG